MNCDGDIQCNRTRFVRAIILGALLMSSLADITSRIGGGRSLFSLYDWVSVDDDSIMKRESRTKPDGLHPVKLDFFVAGFPKAGTTTLAEAFLGHNETAIPETETNIMTIPGTDEEIYKKMQDVLNKLAPHSDNVKRGIKNPLGLGSKPLATARAVQRLEQLFPDTKLIFGLRHPVNYLQSFYNYRVWNHYGGQGILCLMNSQIPSVESLLSTSWMGLSADSARFEDTLKALRKTNKTNDLPPTPFKVFLYTIEQMQDTVKERKEAFRETLGSFLELEFPILPLPHINKRTAIYNETIDICESKYDKIRSILVENGEETQRWIQEEFLWSPDVTVSNENHFRELIQRFGSDPCRQ